MSAARVTISGHYDLRLIKSIMIYANEQHAIATIHDVNGEHLLPGKLVSVQSVSTLLSKLVNTQVQQEIYPENLLYSHTPTNTYLWWVPASKQTLWFESKDGFLKNLSGQTFAQPPLVFLVKNRNLMVYALKENKRPVKDTPLFRAPYFNTTNGKVCLGSTAMPEITNTTLEQAVTAFFASAFTHGNNALLSKFRGSYGEMWVSNQNNFDTSLLIEDDVTLKDILWS